MVFDTDACESSAQDSFVRDRQSAPSQHAISRELPDHVAPRAVHEEQRSSARAHELLEHAVMRSTRELCARLIGELFGREHAQLARDESLDRVDASLYERLAPRLAACDAARDLQALAPCPDVDRSLGRLVSIIQGELVPHTRLGGAHARAVRAELLLQLRSSPQLQARAGVLRRCAGVAEHALEVHWSERLLQRLPRRSATNPAPAGPARVRALAACLSGFPYVQNYLQLTAAELALLECPVRPLLLRDAQRAALPAALRRDFGRALAATYGTALSCEGAEPAGTRRACFAALGSSDLSPRLPARGALRARRELAYAWRERTILVCGCGPLPLSGLMLHALTGARVRLLDRDGLAVAAARRWLDALEQLHVLPRDAVRVCQADVAELDPAAHGADVVLIASLVDPAAKSRLARRLQQQPAPLRLLLRSARGLCAELAYPAVDTCAVSHAALPFCGESVPEHLSEPGEQSVLVRAPHTVLNTTELFHNLPLPAANAGQLSALQAALDHARRAPANPE